ncbi:MAG: hypothetical protein QXQ87_04600 [Halobacteria archaeon]
MRSWILPEPELSFGKGDKHVDPKAGLTMFGPFVAEGQTQSSLGAINLGLIGPRNAVSFAESWLGEVQSTIAASQKDPMLFPSFPGFESVFRSKIELPKALREEIPQAEVNRVLGILDPRDRVVEAAKLYLTRIDQFRSLEPKASVVICVIPKEIEEHCWSSRGSKPTPEERKTQKLQKKWREKGQLFLADFDEKITPVVEAPGRGTNLRARIKASAMLLGVKTQLLRETTLSGERGVQPRGTMAWNFCVALYYKAGGFPWRLAHIRENTCFVGISFYRERGWDPATMGTAIAQVFDRTGEGLILKGARVEWSKGDRRSPHLNKDAARNLVEKVMNAYRSRQRGIPERVVFHKTSRFWPEELEGMRQALPTNTQADFLAIEEGSLRFVRDGKYPPLRGTCIALGDREYVVYGMGYIQYLNTYPGHHVPSPLHVIEHVGEATPQQVCGEMLALTKLNWNTAQYCCGVPITLNIARRVSSVLAELPEDANVDPSYRFYM